MPALSVLAHHSEPSDPVLLRWVFDTFEAITGLGPTAVVLPIASAIIAFPVLLGFFALRARRQARYDVGADVEGGDGRLAK